MTKKFGDYLRRKRREKKKSQRALAQEAGINFTYLSKVENDVPGFDTLSEPTLANAAGSAPLIQTWAPRPASSPNNAPRRSGSR